MQKAPGQEEQQQAVRRWEAGALEGADIASVNLLRWERVPQCQPSWHWVSEVENSSESESAVGEARSWRLCLPQPGACSLFHAEWESFTWVKIQNNTIRHIGYGDVPLARKALQQVSPSPRGRGLSVYSSTCICIVFHWENPKDHSGLLGFIPWFVGFSGCCQQMLAIWACAEFATGWNTDMQIHLWLGKCLLSLCTIQSS